MKKIFKFLIQYYLKMLAKIVLWRHKPLIVAISGTTNKTFIKDLLLKEIDNNLEVRGNPRSFNTEIGLPLAVLFLPSGYSSVFKWADVLFEGTLISLFSQKFPSILVLEMGVDCKGDMNYLLSIIKPSIAIVTNIDKSYPDHNTSVSDIVNEMGELVRSIDRGGAVFLNGDDVMVKELEKLAEAEVITWGSGNDFSINIHDIQKTESGQRFRISYKNREELIEIEKFGYHNISAKAVAKIAAEEILKRKNKSV